MTATDLLAELDAYFDAAPRPDSDAVAVGPFTLFVSRTPWAYYARPAAGGPIGAPDLEALSAACTAAGVELSLEWIHDLHPELAAEAAAYGLEVRLHALLSASAGDLAPVPDDRFRILAPGDPATAAARAVADVAFGAGGTGTGPEGGAEREAAAGRLTPALLAHLHDRARRGLTVTGVVERDGVVSVGSYQPAGGLAEIVGVGTLPAYRRQGLAGAVTAALARHALAAGARGVLLSAQDANVARVYEEIGFRRVGTVGAAE